MPSLRITVAFAVLLSIIVQFFMENDAQCNGIHSGATGSCHADFSKRIQNLFKGIFHTKSECAENGGTCMPVGGIVGGPGVSPSYACC
ncbi:hypothetical protein DdX_11203 [Ditylenchus destructor]|uniref:Uncharacterized protein n=1 Tax=Ditylenchus destructor TaxID=166010 RepID=A0AAD4N397_9BILA|nr:hypothetical protein DdX_11203 [Ditylenchus destructor]